MVVVVVLVVAVVLNATGMAAAGMALWRDTGPRLENAGALLLNLVLFIVNVWQLAAAK